MYTSKSRTEAYNSPQNPTEKDKATADSRREQWLPRGVSTERMQTQAIKRILHLETIRQIVLGSECTKSKDVNFKLLKRRCRVVQHVGFQNPSDGRQHVYQLGSICL